jgi:hypothetical protein
VLTAATRRKAVRLTPRVVAAVVAGVAVAGAAGYKGVAVVAGSGSSTPRFICNDSVFPGGSGTNINMDVEVPEGSVCHVYGWNIHGNLKVEKSGKVFAKKGTTVHGDVIADEPTQVNLEGDSSTSGQSIIYGSLRVKGTDKGAFGGFACGVLINGSVILEDLTSGTWVIGEPSNPSAEDGTYDYGSGDPDLRCEAPNTINGSVVFIDSHKVNRLELAANTIGGSVAILENTVVNEQIDVEGNSIGGYLACSDNKWTAGFTPVVTNAGQPNSTGGSKTGQCAGL